MWSLSLFIVPGGSGFIGKHLRRYLAKLNLPCTYISRGQHSPADLFGSLERYMHVDDFEAGPGEALIAEGRFLVYLVSNSVPGTFADAPWQEVHANVEYAFKTFWRVAKINPNIKIILISSGGTVYGNQPVGPTDETVAVTPMSGYGAGKVMIEEALRFVARATNTPFSILRVANPIGEFQTSERQGIVGVAIRGALTGAPVQLFGGGEQVRDYIAADDVAEAIVAATASGVPAAGTWNISSGVGYSVLEMIAFVEEVTQQTITLEFVSGRAVDVAHIVLDNSLAARELNWVPWRVIPETLRDICGAFDRIAVDHLG
jgi:UDP-glucose 4-epimerase